MGLAATGFGVCLALAAAPDAPPAYVPVQAFTLAWTHSIEQVRWEEDYVVKAPLNDSAPPRLVAGIARVRGSAAGMEPPPEAVLRDSWYEYQPSQDLPPALRLTRSQYVPDFEWCVGQRCRPMTDIFPTDGGITLLSACRDPAAPAQAAIAAE